MHKTILYEARHEKKVRSSQFNMAAQKEEKLAEALRIYPVLFDKSDRFFKDRNKKRLAWEDVAKEANFDSGKFNFTVLKCFL